MERYKEYKDSGVPWIGQVPNHWKTYRFGTLCKVKSICDCVDEELLSVYLDRGVIRFSDDDNRRTNPTSKDLTKYQLVEPGDFVLNNQQAWRGSVGVSKYRGIVSPAYFIFSLSPKLNTDFANLMFRSRNYVANYYVCSKGIGSIQRNLDWGQLKQRSIFLPPLPEQQKIVSYLESKTSSIDAYVAEKEKELQLLNELKEAEIANVVTRGLNPNVKMKDSGIPWIGMIPEHWQIKQLRAFLKLFSVKGHGNAQLLSVTREQGVILRDKDNKEENHNFVPEDLSGYKYVEKGDFVINKMKAWQGSYAVSKYDGIVSPAYFTCKLCGVDKDFFSLAIRSKAYVGFFTSYSKGIRVGQWDLDPNALKSIPFFLPPQKEQRAIVAYIEDKCAKVNTLITELESEIDYLKEYKQRLIADCVTGQVNVLEK